MQPGPGTWGTIGAMPFGIIILMFGGIPALLFATIITFAIGIWASKHFEQMVREKDSGMIVIDEVVGVWIALIPAILTPASVITAFILFRFFDIIKPWPISWLDKKSFGASGGAWGVMLDDVLAGIFSAVIMIGLRYAGIF